MGSSRYATTDEIKAGLFARRREVCERYAPGGHVRDGKWWALNPGRADRSIGSFWVNLEGEYAGRWRDASSGEGGDLLDLIGLAIGGGAKAGFDEARAFLGMGDETPEQQALRRRQAERLRREEDARKAREAEALEKKRGKALAMWTRAHERIEGTPVQAYLAGRGITFEALGRIPRAIRFAPALTYRHVTPERIDPETGEVFPERVELSEWPAMVTLIGGPSAEGGAGKCWGVHRTWLAQREDGGWGKAPVPEPKKVYGTFRRGFIRLVRGEGPRGGAVPAGRAPDGSVAFLAEGIEDALSVAIIQRMAGFRSRPWYSFAAVALDNMKAVELPPQCSSVVIVADNDPGEKQRAVIGAACDRFARQGRAVSVWRNRYGGKDANDALLAALEAERQGGAAGPHVNACQTKKCEGRCGTR